MIPLERASGGSAVAGGRAERRGCACAWVGAALDARGCRQLQGEAWGKSRTPSGRSPRRGARTLRSWLRISRLL